MQAIRNFSDFSNKKFFPGSINKTTNEYVFPILYHTDDKNNIRMWKISIRLIKGSKKKYNIDWDLLKDNIVLIKESYLKDEKLPNDINVQYYVETGVIDKKITRHPPSYGEYKNINKINERNPFQHALVMGRSKYLKKIESGFSTNKTLDKKNTNKKFFPMLVHKYNDKKEKLIYPLYIQPKLDGTRCIIFLNKPNNKNINKCTIDDITMYTRQQKDYLGFNDIKKWFLKPLIKLWNNDNNESIYIDGELYLHGENLQTISGAVRNSNRENIDNYKNIQYWAFDTFYPSKLNLKFIDRLNIIKNIFIDNKLNDILVIQTPTHLVENEIQLDNLYKDYINNKYEGIIVRNKDSLYLTHPTKESAKIRSSFVLKRKKRYSNEYELIDFKQGTKGRDIGAILWVLKTIDSQKKEHIFNATPKNITYKERYELFTKLDNNKDIFNKNYKNRMMTIEYEDLSKNNVPLRAKSIGFRDYL